MRLISIFFLSVLALTAGAQRVSIGYPLDGASVTSGSNVTVEIDRPDTLSGSTEVAIVIGFASCASFPCSLPSSNMGSILYNGGYDPEFQSDGPGSKPPHQNFSVGIPSTAVAGRGQLNVAHVSLIGAGQTMFSEVMNVTVNVVSP